MFLRTYKAEPSDLDWMYRMYMEAAEHGHFVINSKDRRQCEALRRNLREVIERQFMPDFKLRAQAMVFEDEGELVGYAIMSEIRTGMGGNEIQVFIVEPEKRGCGYGSLMLREIVWRWHAHADIYARCFPASDGMRMLLTKAGFSCLGQNQEGAEVLWLEKLRRGAA